MKQTLTVGRFLDIRVGVHVSWIVVYAFMTVSIANAVEGLARPASLAFGAMCALLLFASVVAHEFAHALVARRFNVGTSSIVLFLFGGVATLEREPPTPRAEVAIALAGPAASAAIGVACFGALKVLETFASGRAAEALALVIGYLAVANGVLAAFNVIPAYPMDGGRVLRAAIWRSRRSLAAATGAASIVGLVFAALLASGGLVLVVVQHAWAAAWYTVIGAFLLRQGWSQLRASRAVERSELARAGAEVAAA